MGFVHDADVGATLEIGSYTVSVSETDPGEAPESIVLEIEGPDRSQTVTIDRATWYRPERDDTAPHSPQYRVEGGLIHIGLTRGGNVGHDSAELVVEAPETVPISVPGPDES